MSEQYAESSQSAREKVYLAIIAVLIALVVYLITSRPSANPQTPVPAKLTAPQTTTSPPPESKPVLEGWAQFPMNDESKNWLAGNHIESVILLDNKLQARVSDKDGKEVKACARAVDGGTHIEGECAKMNASTITRATTIFVEVTESSPGWCRTYIYGHIYYYPC